MKKDTKQNLKEALIELLLTLLCMEIGMLTANLFGASVESENVDYDLIILLGFVIFFVIFVVLVALVKWVKKAFKTTQIADAFAKPSALKIIIIVCIIAFAVISFMPCGEYGYMYHSTVEVQGWVSISETVDYMPSLCCAFSVVEIALLFAKNYKFRLIGFLLNFLKGFIPLLILCYGEIFGGVGDYISYELTELGSKLVLVGVLIGVLYVIEFICDIRRIRSAQKTEELRIE